MAKPGRDLLAAAQAAQADPARPGELSVARAAALAPARPVAADPALPAEHSGGPSVAQVLGGLAAVLPADRVAGAVA